MSSAAGPRGLEGGSGWYVYGVVAVGEASADFFAGVRGVNPAAPVGLVAAGRLAAIANEVPLSEFGEGAVEDNLRRPEWLEERVLAHDAVLETALERAPVIPLRFGTVFRDEEHVRRMLSEHADLAETLERFRGTVELGLKGFLEPNATDVAAAGQEGEPATGGEYLRRKQLARRREHERDAIAAEVAQTTHDRLLEAAEAGRANPLQRPEVAAPAGEMFLNAAYLVRLDRSDEFRAALSELEARYGGDGVKYELTGPWPPYNFVDAESPGE